MIYTTHELIRVLDESKTFEWVKLFPKDSEVNIVNPSLEKGWHKDYSVYSRKEPLHNPTRNDIQEILNKTISYEEALELSKEELTNIFDLGHAEDVLSVSTDSPVTRCWVALTADNHVVVQYDPLQGDSYTTIIMGGHWVVPAE